MIDPKSLSADWLAEKRKKYTKDPTIMEGMIHALYLLEQLKLTGLDFIFKGGTSLVLLMEKPLRFSVDIDIVVSPTLTRDELEQYLSKLVESSEFTGVELDEKRSYNANIPKAHYKFKYKSNHLMKKDGKETYEREILLDILFAENPYPVLVERPIQTDWVIMNGEPLLVKTPDINSIAGDKLVAFAPSTTGVPYGQEKEKEIIKQLFDVGCLFHLISDRDILKKSYETSAISEMKYRAERGIKSIEEILRDTIETGLLIAGGNKSEDEDGKRKYDELIKGIGQFTHFVFEGNFRTDHAQVASAKAAYLAAIILTNHAEDTEIFDSKIPLTDYMITHPDFNYLNKKIKFIAGGEALFYWHKTLKLLHPEN